MNSLDALATAAKEGAGIVRVASWLAETDLIAGHPVRASIRVAHGPRQPIDRIIVQFFNRAKWPWYTKPLIDRASWPPSNERRFDSNRFDRCAD